MQVRKSGLTLVEVIVVTVIILILAGLVTTVTLRGIGSAKRNSCLSNLRSIGQALYAYAADHDDALPPYFWRDFNYGENRAAFKKAVQPYGLPDAQWFCPLDEAARTPLVAELGDHLESSYAHNIQLDHLGTVGSSWFLRLGSIERPTSTVWYFDHYSRVRLPDGGQQIVTNHGKDDNVLLVDGHVEHAADPMSHRPPE